MLGWERREFCHFSRLGRGRIEPWQTVAHLFPGEPRPGHDEPVPNGPETHMTTGQRIGILVAEHFLVVDQELDHVAPADHAAVPPAPVDVVVITSERRDADRGVLADDFATPEQLGSAVAVAGQEQAVPAVEALAVGAEREAHVPQDIVGRRGDEAQGNVELDLLVALVRCLAEHAGHVQGFAHHEVPAPLALPANIHAEVPFSPGPFGWGLLE